MTDLEKFEKEELPRIKEHVFVYSTHECSNCKQLIQAFEQAMVLLREEREWCAKIVENFEEDWWTKRLRYAIAEEISRAEEKKKNLGTAWVSIGDDNNLIGISWYREHLQDNVRHQKVRLIKIGSAK